MPYLFFAFLLTPISTEFPIWRFEVQETYIQQSKQITHVAGSGDHFPKRDTYPYIPKSISKILVPCAWFIYDQVAITVDASQKPVEAVLIGPLGDIMHIQENTLNSLKNRESFIS